MGNLGGFQALPHAKCVRTGKSFHSANLYFLICIMGVVCLSGVLLWASVIIRRDNV